ncbi:hypothetical protein ACVGWT_11725, partial [Enterobacter hormaechei]
CCPEGLREPGRPARRPGKRSGPRQFYRTHKIKNPALKAGFFLLAPLTGLERVPYGFTVRRYTDRTTVESLWRRILKAKKNF